MSYIPASLRQLVTDRAENRCEYCLFPQAASLFTFEMEHIVSEKHGGLSQAENLALACPYCNRAKGSDLGSIDPLTQRLTPFFNPRTQLWTEHFQLNNGTILPSTSEGRVTAIIFQFNVPERIQERERLITQE